MSQQFEIQRILPQAVELEEAVLGATMLERDAPPVSVNLLEPEMFYRDEHKIIFSAIKRMYDAGEPIDIGTVYNHMRSRKTTEIITGGQYATEADKVGGAYYISQLTNRVASAANLEFHCRIIIQKWVLRQIIYHGQLAVNRAYNDDPDIFSVLDDIGDLILMRDKLTSSSKDIAPVSFAVDREIEDYDVRVAANLSGRVVGVPTGFPQVDRFTMGWQGGKLIVLASRPGMGKTALTGDFTINAAIFKMPTAFFSIEMPEMEITQRLLSNIAEIDNYQYQRGNLIPQDVEKLNKARLKLASLPIYIDDTHAISITSLRAKARRLKQKHNIKLIVVDYLQLMDGKPTEKRNGNREQEISSISRGLKALAKELDIPVIALSQLNRAVETRGGDKRPQLSDLRESGAIEQDADMVIFIHRPEYYGMTRDGDGNSTAGVAELIWAKHRGGMTGSINVNFIANHTKFIDPNAYEQRSLRPNTNFYETEKEPF